MALHWEESMSKFDRWFDDQLNKGGFWFWLILLLGCAGVYGGLVLALSIGPQ